MRAEMKRQERWWRVHLENSESSQGNERQVHEEGKHEKNAKCLKRITKTEKTHIFKAHSVALTLFF